jgi:hypothetical protein
MRCVQESIVAVEKQYSIFLRVRLCVGGWMHGLERVISRV